MADEVIIKMSEADFRHAMSRYEGFCLLCGETEVHQCEPDARDRECPNCLENGVVGAELALVMDRVEFTDDEE